MDEASPEILKTLGTSQSGYRNSRNNDFDDLQMMTEGRYESFK